MILVDSSVWIDFLSASPGTAGHELRRLITEGEPLGLTGIVLTEVLQGLTRDVAAIERYLAQFDFLEPKGFENYRAAAAIFRRGRSRGVQLTTIDTLIASIAIEYGATLFTLDRDFSRIAQFAPLKLYWPR